jgi:hypothetical protein
VSLREQGWLLSCLPEILARMALSKVNTGTREQAGRTRPQVLRLKRLLLVRLGFFQMAGHPSTLAFG